MKGLGRRTYRGGLFPVFLVVSVRFSDRLHRWLVYFSPLNLTPMCLLVRFRFRIAKYLQTLGTERPQARQSVVRYLVEALALDEIVEMEKSQYRVCKHPFTLPLHAPVAAFFTAGFVGLLEPSAGDAPWHRMAMDCLAHGTATPGLDAIRRCVCGDLGVDGDPLLQEVLCGCNRRSVPLHEKPRWRDFLCRIWPIMDCGSHAILF